MVRPPLEDIDIDYNVTISRGFSMNVLQECVLCLSKIVLLFSSGINAWNAGHATFMGVFTLRSYHLPDEMLGTIHKYGFAAAWPILRMHGQCGNNDHKTRARPPYVASTPCSGQGPGPTPAPTPSPTDENVSPDEGSDDSKWLDAAWEVAVTVVGGAVMAVGAGCMAFACRRTRSFPWPCSRACAHGERAKGSTAEVSGPKRKESALYVDLS